MFHRVTPAGGQWKSEAITHVPSLGGSLSVFSQVMLHLVLSAILVLLSFSFPQTLFWHLSCARPVHKVSLWAYNYARLFWCNDEQERHSLYSPET